MTPGTFSLQSTLQTGERCIAVAKTQVSRYSLHLFIFGLFTHGLFSSGAIFSKVISLKQLGTRQISRISFLTPWVPELQSPFLLPVKMESRATKGRNCILEKTNIDYSPITDTFTA